MTAADFSTEAAKLPGRRALEPGEVATAISVLEAVVEDRALLALLDDETRRRLLVAAGRASRPERDELRDLCKALRRKERLARRAADERVLDSTLVRVKRAEPVYQTPPPVSGNEHEVEDASSHARAGAPELAESRKCYVCKAEFRTVHFFYDSMCPPCAELNWTKRNQSVRLDGRVALVSGARVKIGYQAAIKLLRAGCRVIVSTRFPQDAARRYASEEDFEAWRERLTIHGLDLRHTPSVERFAAHLDATLDRLDFIVHNACQTVRRPPGFYGHLVEAETAPPEALPASTRGVLAHAGEPALARRDRDLGWDPVKMALVPMAPGDAEGGQALFPAGQLDQDEQQVDLRNVNSWRLTLADVPTIELLEVHLVNAVAPFVLNARLKPLMLRDKTFDKHIVNVSAVEGQFYRSHKTDRHPHTNMAKAALNMMTRTSAVDYAKDGIFMNSVDTGWVTDEDPVAIAVRKVEEHGFHPPLDIVDGAARILDPIFSGWATGNHAYGVFFKDYLQTRW